MNRHLHIANRWLGRNIGKWLPALTILGVVLACLAHWNDPQSVFITSTMRG